MEPKARNHQMFVTVCLLLQAVVLSISSSWTTGTASHSQSDSDTELVLLQLLFRHGDRSPIHMYSWDEHKSAWPQGTGQLTKLGMEQAYKYGEELRQRYAGFLPSEYSQFAVEAKSTDYDRTLMTVQCMLVGLFPSHMSSWSPSPWQPIPIHTQSNEADHLFGRASCPRLDQLEEQDSTGRKEQLKAKYKPLYEQMSNSLNITLDQDTSPDCYISDTMFCEAQHNMSRPPWMTDAMFQELMNLRNDSYEIIVLEPGEARLKGGPLLIEMTSNMEQKAQNTSSREKLFLFSAHDNTVAALGRVMGVFNNLCPPYLTTFLLELHRNGSGEGGETQFFVRTLFHNHSRDSPYVNTIPGCQELCPLSEFRRLLEANMLAAEDREKACTVTSTSLLWREDGLSILVGALIVLAVAVAVLAFKLRKGRSLQREPGGAQYRKLLKDNEEGDDDDDDDL